MTITPRTEPKKLKYPVLLAATATAAVATLASCQQQQTQSIQQQPMATGGIVVSCLK